jgi:hypothetical protein
MVDCSCQHNRHAACTLRMRLFEPACWHGLILYMCPVPVLFLDHNSMHPITTQCTQTCLCHMDAF